MKNVRAAFLVLPIIAITACVSSKSSNPLSPSIAGPISGVNISPPKILEPWAGAQVDATKQPVTLLLENAVSNGVRPLTYTFEVASDAGFTAKIFTREAVVTGEGGRTSLRLPDPLAGGRTYYWRARAEDGANTGPFSAAVNFNVFIPIVISAPVLTAPANGATVTTASPRFAFTNAPTSGPVGVMSYTIEIATNDSFSNKVAIWNVPQQVTETSIDALSSLSYATQYFWHVRGYDPTTTGPWSATQVFQTPAAPVASAPPSGGVGGGSVGNWQGCGSTAGAALVACVHAAVNPARTEAGAFEVTKRVAWLLRGEGGGLLIKNGGENIVSWQGYSFAAGRICYPDGHIYKVLTDVPGTNGPGWADNGFVDRSLYLPAINPGN